MIPILRTMTHGNMIETHTDNGEDHLIAKIPLMAYGLGFRFQGLGFWGYANSALV